MLHVVLALMMLIPVDGQVQQRNFRVMVNGKPSGTYTQTIKTTAMTTEVTNTSTVDVKVLFVKYHYSFSNSEEWMGKGTALQLYQVKADLDDNGALMRTAISPSQGNLLLKSNVTEQVIPRDSWTATFWCLPPLEVRDKVVTLANFELGKPEKVRLTFIGKETLNNIECTHWKCSGQTGVDLWYDQSERLVRRTMTRKGQATVVELVSIQ